jgi:hypothetical protein
MENPPFSFDFIVNNRRLIHFIGAINGGVKIVALL